MLSQNIKNDKQLKESYLKALIKLYKHPWVCKMQIKRDK